MWQKYFRVVKIKPGRVNTALLGLIDLSDPNIALDKIVHLFENDFPYLEITNEGRHELYGATKPLVVTEKPLPIVEEVSKGAASFFPKSKSTSKSKRRSTFKKPRSSP